nr:hypothetical transcript [Hymenolepis microstoma]
MQNWRRAILSEDSYQTQEELSESLVGISEQAFSKRLKQLGMIEKEGYWVPHELKLRGDVERHVAPSADFHLTHLAQWHTAWLTSTSARMKKRK